MAVIYWKLGQATYLLIEYFHISDVIDRLIMNMHARVIIHEDGHKYA